MEELSIPIFKKNYDFYKEFYGYLKTFPRSDRYSLGQKCEQYILEILECIILASQLPKSEKLPILEKASSKLNILRILIRLAKEIKALDNKKYLTSEKHLDEIGRMLGGWIKSTKSPS
jgi:hypothetical protein